jgi:hypothetical protein
MPMARTDLWVLKGWFSKLTRRQMTELAHGKLPRLISYEATRARVRRRLKRPLTKAEGDNLAMLARRLGCFKGDERMEKPFEFSELPLPLFVSLGIFKYGPEAPRYLNVGSVLEEGEAGRRAVIAILNRYRGADEQLPLDAPMIPDTDIPEQMRPLRAVMADDMTDEDNQLEEHIYQLMQQLTPVGRASLYYALGADLEAEGYTDGIEFHGEAAPKQYN